MSCGPTTHQCQRGRLVPVTAAGPSQEQEEWGDPSSGTRPVALGTCLRDPPVLGKTWTLVPLP